MAFPQTPVEVPLYMNIPKGYSGPVISKKTNMLEVAEEPLWTKQGPRVWSKFLEKGLLKVGFKVSQVDPICTTKIWWFF